MNKKHLNNVAIIPARSGSKRLKNKNILNFKGKPMICWSIEAALKSRIFDKIFVSSDSKKILKIASKYDQVILDKRAKKLADDKSRVVDVVDYLIHKYELTSYKVLSVLYPTSPLRNYLDIRNTFNLLDRGCDSSLAITNYDLPVYQALELRKRSNYLKPLMPSLINLNVNKVKKSYYCDNGSTYFCKMSYFLKKKSLYGKKIKGYPMSKNRSIDIDTIYDFEFLNFISSKK